MGNPGLEIHLVNYPGHLSNQLTITLRGGVGSWGPQRIDGFFIRILLDICNDNTFDPLINICWLLHARHCAILVCGWVVIKMWRPFPRNSCLWKRWTYKQQTPNIPYAVCNNRDVKKVLEGHRGRIQGASKKTWHLSWLPRGVRILQVEKRHEDISGRGNSFRWCERIWLIWFD